MAASRWTLLTEARFSIPGHSIWDIWRTDLFASISFLQCLYHSTNDLYSFILTLLNGKVIWRRLGTLKGAMIFQISDSLRYENLFVIFIGLWRFFVFLWSFFFVSRVLLLTPEVSTYSNIFYGEYTTLNFKYCETLFTPKC